MAVTPLTGQVTLPETSANINGGNGDGEGAWIEVIQRMDEIYADLVNSQVELEQKNADLEDAHSFIDSVISSISDVLVVCDIDGRIQRVNRALEQLTGRNAEALINQPLATLFGADSQQQVAGFAEHIRADALIDCEVELLDRDGRPAPMAINCSARYDHDRRLSGLVMTGRPLGELRRAYGELHQAHQALMAAQQQLIQSEKLASLGRLVAGVAHELNNPISFVFGNMHALDRYRVRLQKYLELVHSDCPPEALAAARAQYKIDRTLEDIGPLIEGSLEGAERVSDIVQNLRRFATPQEQKATRFDLVQVVSSAVQWVINASRHKPELRTDLPERLELFGSEGHVHQIIVNLVQNAIDAMDGEPPPVLDIAAGSDEREAWVTIRDHGPGIKEGDLLRIFDPFFTTKAVGKGTGLGLYISYGLATEQIGGDLSAANHAEGGAVFRLSLPLQALPGATT